MPHVLLIEDDALVRKLLEKRLIAAGWEVTALRDGRRMLESVQGRTVDLVLMDLMLPYGDGLSLVEKLRAAGMEAPILVVTGSEQPHLRATVRSTGATDLVQKPYDQEDLLRQMARLLAA